MNTEAQIVEMAKICCLICEFEHCGECLNGPGLGNCGMAMLTAQKLYNAGYRKASDVVAEIFEEIINPINRAIQFYDMLSINTFDSIEQARASASKEALQAIRDTFSELRKKYIKSEGEE